MQKDTSYYRGKSALAERFIHAFRGIRYAWQKESNFKIEAVIAVGVLGMMIALPLTGAERAILVVVITFVLTLEIINSVFERMIDLVHPRFSPEVKRIKDTMAGAVLLASGASIIVAGFILVRPLVVFDHTLEQFLEYVRTPLVVAIARGVTLLGDWQVVGGLAIIITVILFFRKEYKNASLLAGGVAMGELVLLALKFGFGRDRPPEGAFYSHYHLSFPSGHAFMGTVLWLTLGYILTHSDTERKYLWAICVAITLLIAVSRIVLSVHWFSDVVGGLLLGLFWFLLWFGINEKLFEKK